MNKPISRKGQSAWILNTRQCLQRKGGVLYQLCHFSSKRLDEKWHNWYSTSPFLYKNSDYLGFDSR